MAAAQHTSSFPLGYPSWLQGIAEGAFAETLLPATTFVLIIGGGLAGVATAYYLAARGIDVVLLEQGRLCGGSSGRNGGFISPGRSDYGEAVDRHGPELAEAIVRFEVESTSELAAVTQKLGIEADLRFNGNGALAFDEDGMRKIQRSAELLRGIEFSVEVWERQECFSRTGGPNFLGGLFRPNGGTLSPAKLVVGLAEAAVSLGATIKTYTQVRDLQRRAGGREILALTSGGNIAAEHVVFATNTVEPRLLPALGRVLEPVRGQVIATRPLSRRIWEVGLSTIDGLVYWQQDSSRRIVIGGMRHVVPGMEVGVTDITQTDSRVGGALRTFLQDQFAGVLPQRLEVAYEWTGLMAVPKDGLPLVGRLSLPSYFANTWLILGFGGHGMPVIPGAALALAQMILGEIPANFVEAFRPTAERFAASV